MTSVFFDDFETGDLSKWDSGATLSVSGSAAHDGSYGAAADVLTAIIADVANLTSLSIGDAVFAGFWLNLSGDPIPGTYANLLIIGDETGNTEVSVQLQKTGGSHQLRLSLTAPSGVTSSWYTVYSGTWMFVSIACVVNENSKASLYIDGALIESISDGDVGSNNNFDSVALGVLSPSGGSGSLYMDTLAISDRGLVYPLYDHGDDVFIIHPKSDNIDDITFTLDGKDKSSNLIVLSDSINTHDKERAEYVLANGLIAPNMDQNTVPFEFKFRAQGYTSEQVLGLERKISTALSDSLGGTIEYKPARVNGFVRNTFYHYVPSASVEIARTGSRFRESIESHRRMNSNTVGLDFVCSVDTKTVPTSDPDSPYDICEDSITNSGDSTPPNYIVIDGWMVNGDAIFPKLVLTATNTDFGPQDSYGGVVIYKYAVPLGDDSSLGFEWMEAEDSLAYFLADWSSELSANHSGGEAMYGGTYLYFNSFNSAKMYCCGPVTPIVIGGRHTSGTPTFTFWWVRCEVDGTPTQQEILEVGHVTQLDTNYDTVLEIQTTNLPPFDPGHYDLSDVIEDVVGPLCARITPDGSDSEVDALLLLPSWDWIAALAAPLHGGSLGGRYYDLVNYSLQVNNLEIDAMIGSSHVVDGTDNYKLMRWNEQGCQIEKLALKSGEDSVIGFLFSSGIDSPNYLHNYTGVYDSRCECDIVVTGVFATIAPFDEP